MTLTFNSPIFSFASAQIWRRVMMFADTIAGAVVADNRTERFETLIGRHAGLLSRICYMYAQSADEYQEMRQDALINIWRGLDSFRGDANESTWIYRICFNTCVSSLRLKTRRSKKFIPLSTLFESIPDSSTETDARVEKLHALISCLSADDRAMIIMWLDEMSYDSIADVMGLGRNTVATRLHRIKTKLITLNNSQQ